jgi:hypothetical protein
MAHNRVDHYRQDWVSFLEGEKPVAYGTIAMLEFAFDEIRWSRQKNVGVLVTAGAPQILALQRLEGSEASAGIVSRRDTVTARLMSQ